MAGTNPKDEAPSAAVEAPKVQIAPDMSLVVNEIALSNDESGIHFADDGGEAL